MNAYRANLKRKYPDCWQWISLARRIPGQLTEDESNLLFQLARARTPSIDPVIVELGAGRGKTAALLAAGLCGKTRPRLFSMQRAGEAGSDIGAGSEMDQQALHRNLRRCGLAHILGTTADWSGPDSEGRRAIDILLINATAEGDALHNDLSHWAPFVKLGGIVILRGASLENLPSPHYSDLRQVETLAFAVKQSPASLPAGATDEIHSDAGVKQLRYLLDRSIDAMLRQYSTPGVLDEQLFHRDARGEHLKDVTEIAMARLQDYVRRSAKQLAEDRHAIRALHRSWSWRLTKPLRLSIELLNATAGLFGSFAHGSPRTRIAGLTQWILFGKQLRASGLLDERYYRDLYHDVAWARTSPVLHFCVCGVSEGKNPNELFDVDYYLRRYPDVAQSGVNPLVNYLKTGAYEGRDPHPHFDSSFYLEQNPDVRESGLNPLAHYLAPGIAEGRDPNPWFNTLEYLEQNPDVATFGLNPLTHHLCSL